MGIVRLAKSLKLLNSLIEHRSRKDDIRSKISGNRVYMDFVSIVYRIQEKIARELNYILYSYYLLQEDLLDISEIPVLRDLVRKYPDAVADPIKTLINDLYIEYDDADLSTYSILKSPIYIKLKKNITFEYLNAYKEDVRRSNNLNIYIYRDIINFIVDMLTHKITGVEYILIAFDGIPSFGKVQEQRQRRYMRLAYNEFEEALLDITVHDSNKKDDDYDSIKKKLFRLRKIYDIDHFTVNIRSAIDYVYGTYHTGELQRDIESGIVNFRKDDPVLQPTSLEIEVIDRPYGEGEKILMDRLIRDATKYTDDKSYVFYSPDGDSVLLCLYAYIKTKVISLNVVKSYELNPSTRHNHQSQYIDIKILYDSIVNIVNKHSKIDDLEEEDRDSICRDYIFMLNLYGNDFIHQIPSMEISTTILDLFYIYSLFIKEKSNRYITRMVDGKVHIDIDVMTRFFQYLSEYEEYLMLDTYLINVDNRSRFFSIFGNIFPHRYLIRYRELVSQLKSQLYNDLTGKGKIKPNVNDVKKALSDFQIVLSESVTVSGKKFSDIFKKLEMNKGFDEYASRIASDPEYLLTDEPKFIYNIRTRNNREEGTVKKLVALAEGSLYLTGESIDLSAIESSRDKTLANFSFDYGNMRDLLPHDQMPITSNDIDLFFLEWRSGDWQTVLNSRSHELGYDSKNKSIRGVKSEQTRYQKHMLQMPDKKLDKMIGNYMRTLSWVVDYYMNSNIEVDQDLISTWSYNYERSPMITHISDYLVNFDRKDLKNMIKKVYDKSLIHTSRYLQSERHKFYIYPQKREIIDLLDNIHKPVFPDIKAEVSKSMEYLKLLRNNKSGKIKNRTKTFFDCREAPYFSKCIFDAESLTYKDLISIPIPGLKGNEYPEVQLGKGKRSKYDISKYKYGDVRIKKSSSSK
jgi:hypothetical protein